MHLQLGGYLVIDCPSKKLYLGGARMNYMGIDHHRQSSRFIDDHHQGKSSRREKESGVSG
jgi:hypothetical protein